MLLPRNKSFSFSVFLFFIVLFTALSSTDGCNKNGGIPSPAALQNGTRTNCVAQSFDHDSFVCVCNSSHCDAAPAAPEPSTLQRGAYFVVVSDRRQFRLASATVEASGAGGGEVDVELVVDGRKKKQEIIGFGGAFTDATGENIASLSVETRERLMRSYFGPGSAEYSVARIPMGGTDFSSRPYSYADVDGDFELNHFSLADEDLTLKIPFIQLANRISTRRIKYFGSPWSAPPWMKTNGDWKGYGQLKGNHGGPYYKTWAQYFVRFLEEYDKRNVTLWGLTTQNEPEDGYVPFFPFNCMGFTAKESRDFVVHNLGPELERSKFADVKVMTFDDNRFRILRWLDDFFNGGKDEEAMKYVAGTAVHWYWNILKPATIFSEVHDKYPEKFILATEACEGWEPFSHTVNLGDWTRAEEYAHSIIEDLQNWVTGWTDWNMALNLKGGPNWVNNFVDAPIIVDKDNDVFLKQPMFYALTHFSKYIPPGSRVIEVTPRDVSRVESIAADTPEGTRVIVIHNRNLLSKRLRIVDDEIRNNNNNNTKDGIIRIEAPPKSLTTIVWKPEREIRVRD